jgi:hypothetical protein
MILSRQCVDLLEQTLTDHGAPLCELLPGRLIARFHFRRIARVAVVILQMAARMIRRSVERPAIGS